MSWAATAARLTRKSTISELFVVRSLLKIKFCVPGILKMYSRAGFPPKTTLVEGEMLLGKRRALV